MTEKTCILVTGIPYSGKSLPAGVLHHLGVYMGNFQLHPDPIYNPHDYYEHPKFTDINADVTKTRKINGMIRAVYDFYNHNKVYRYDNVTQNTISIILSSPTYKKKSIWGFKDPRLCLPFILRDFIQLANEVADEVKLIVCDRDFAEILNGHMIGVQELHQPEKYTQDYIIDYLYHWHDLLAHAYNLFNGDKMSVWFDEVNKSDKFIRKIADFAGVSVTESAKLFLEKRLDYLERN